MIQKRLIRSSESHEGLSFKKKRVSKRQCKAKLNLLILKQDTPEPNRL